MGVVSLVKGLPDRCGDDGVLATGDTSQGVPNPVTAAHSLVASKTRAIAAWRPVRASPIISQTSLSHSSTQGSQELGPERLCFRWADAQADDLPVTFVFRSHSDYGCVRHGPVVLADLQVGGVEPNIGPFAGERGGSDSVHFG